MEQSTAKGGRAYGDLHGTPPGEHAAELQRREDRLSRAASPCAQDAKVTFEWTFAADGHLFHLSYADPEPWPETDRSTREMLLFIYG